MKRLKIIKTFFFLLSIMFLAHFSVDTVYAKTYNGWYTVKMGNEIEFQLPPTLELQSKEYEQIIKDASPLGYLIAYPPGMNRIIAQQKGLNDKILEAFNHYIRVFVYINDTDIQFPLFGQPLDFTKAELEELDELISKGPYFVGISTPACITEVDGIPCVHMVYNTQYPNKPVAINDVYFFYNGYKFYKINMMIRSTEYALWTSGSNDVRNIVNTLSLIR